MVRDDQGGAKSDRGNEGRQDSEEELTSVAESSSEGSGASDSEDGNETSSSGEG